MFGSRVTATNSVWRGCAANSKPHAQDIASGEAGSRVIVPWPMPHSMRKWQPFTRAVSEVMVGHGSCEDYASRAFRSATNEFVIASSGKGFGPCTNDRIA